MSNVKSLLGRIRRVEKKTGVGTPGELFSKLTDAQLWAIMEAPINGSEEDKLERFVEASNWPIKKARAFLADMDRVCLLHSREFDHLSDEQLLEMIMEPMSTEAA